jgi:4-amino-4-deoxy-L-arabinose transferase-like glycosyltransferase
MQKYWFLKNPFVLFSPFLLLFVVLVLKQHSDAMEGDETRYILFAQNLLHGFYSPPAPNINLWNGPGYPIILLPFFAFHLPLISITLMNAVFQYLSIVFLFKALMQLVDFGKTLLFSFFWALCYAAYANIPLIITEPFVVLLISLLILFVSYAFVGKLNKYIFLSGFILGYIALTKIIFGYVLMILFAGSVLLWIKNRKAINYKKSALIMLIAFAVVLPYLAYTYNLTGKLFYWGNSGGMSLYWMSTPFENEYGDWNNESFTASHLDANISDGTEHLKSGHQKDIDYISKFKGVEKDDAYKEIAFRNIKAHPTKYIQNISSNVSRSIFGFPGTYTYQRPLFRIWYFSLLYAFILLCLVPTLLKWRKIDYSVRFLFVTVFVYWGASALASMDNRQFAVVEPIFLFWIAYIIQNSVIFKFKFDKVK